VARAGDILRSPFAFLFQRPQKEELVAEYVIREHHAGRSLDDILSDAYVTNRLSPDQVGRVIERPDVVAAFSSSGAPSQL
jgi:hypothetical protein